MLAEYGCFSEYLHKYKHVEDPFCLYCSQKIKKAKDGMYTFNRTNSNFFLLILARTPEIGQGLGRLLSCGARKPEQT